MELIAIAVLAVTTFGLALLLFRRSNGELSETQFRQLVDMAGHQLATAQNQALQQNSEQFLSLAETRLQTESAKSEAQLKASAEQIDKTISRLREYVENTDRARGESLASLSSVTQALGATTGRLTEILASGQARGQWGERMAEDILQVAGLMEGVQYEKHRQLEGGTGRPDFTFKLPQGLLLHMDVKFPLDAYSKYLESESDPDKALALREFLRAARGRIKEVTSREYIDPANGTLDYVLLFIPNEQVYGFIHENDPVLLDEALHQRVVLCSPFTLFAILVVIRQSLDNFVLTQRTDEILRALGGFNQQWTKFRDQMDTVGRRFESTSRAFRDLVGVRRRVLDRQVERVEGLRLESGLEAEDPGETVPVLESDASVQDGALSFPHGEQQRLLGTDQGET